MQIYSRLNNVLAIIMLAGLMLMLAACGNSNSGGNEAVQSSPAATNTSAANEQEESATRTIDTPNGPLEIPNHPQRIIMDGYLPNMLILGIKPVGATQWELENKVIQDQIDGIENIGERSLEKMLALEPDLIITWLNPAADQNIIDQYSKIAPTLVVPYGHFDNIYELTRYFGDVLNKSAEAEEWIADLDQLSADARSRLAEVIDPEATFALMGVFVVDSNFFVYGDGAYRGGEAIYQHLKLKAPEKQQQEMIGKEEYRQISYEVVADYAGDYIFLDQGDMIAEVWGENEGVWRSLDAVKNDRVFNLDPDLFWGNDPISLKLQIEEVTRMIIEKEANK